MQPKRVLPIDINYILVEYEQIISKKINLKVIQLTKSIEKNEIEGIKSIIPTYSSLLIEYDPSINTVEKMLETITNLANNLEDESENSKSRLVKIPVLYGGDFGPDLTEVARINNLNEHEVIEIHKSNIYRVYMLGFNPGYPYMGGLDKRIATPRLDEPRTKVPAGSVAIGGEQTGIYSITSPGGWRLIGHTPLEMFNPEEDDPTLLRAGDEVMFYEVSLKDYEQIKKDINDGMYKVNIELVDIDE
ncbi:MAG: 5-oxoprolinase subunit PxpB [Clostridia bacterium]